MQAQNIAQTSVPVPADHFSGSLDFSASGWVIVIGGLLGTLARVRILKQCDAPLCLDAAGARHCLYFSVGHFSFVKTRAGPPRL
jgi:hypothetical protein